MAESNTNISTSSLSWVALNAVRGLGPVGIKNLLEQFETPEKVFEQPISSLSRISGVSRRIAESIQSADTFASAEKQLEEAQKLGVTILTLSDPRYPFILKQIFAPPPVLYVKGQLEIFDMHAVGVVGTRQPTSYGEKATATIVQGLTARGLVTVSGLARGIDTCAHCTCLDNGGKTIAVLGCGLDRTYPAENKELARRVIENGVLVSEFPLKTRPEAYNFPRRNRIISGLSAGVVVVEAGRRSGALITANYALQQNRDVFAVPGPITSDKSDGPFNLLKSGATPVRGCEDIVEAIEVIRQQVPLESVSALTQLPEELLSEGERIVLAQLSHEPLRMDQMAEKSRKVVSELFDILLNLELKGFIRQVAGQQFVRV